MDLSEYQTKCQSSCFISESSLETIWNLSSFVQMKKQDNTQSDRTHDVVIWRTFHANEPIPAPPFLFSTHHLLFSFPNYHINESYHRTHAHMGVHLQKIISLLFSETRETSVRQQRRSFRVRITTASRSQSRAIFGNRVEGRTQK